MYKYNNEKEKKRKEKDKIISSSRNQTQHILFSGRTSQTSSTHLSSTCFLKDEHAIHQMVYKDLQDNKLLSSHQYGFCSLHSTSTCLTQHSTNTLLHNIVDYLLGLFFSLACVSSKTHNLQAVLFSSYLVHKSTVVVPGIPNVSVVNLQNSY